MTLNTLSNSLMNDAGDTLRLLVLSDLHNEFERNGNSPKPVGPSHPSKGYDAHKLMRRGDPSHPKFGPLLAHLRGEHIDGIILAGDIDVEKPDRGIRSVGYADELSRYLDAPVFQICGNHEAYGGIPLERLHDDMWAAAAETDGRVSFLENDTATLMLNGRPTFVLGCTLWTDFAINAMDADPELAEHLRMYGHSVGYPYDVDSAIELAMKKAADSMNDFRGGVYMGDEKFTPEMSRQLHWQSRRWLKEESARIREQHGEDASIIVVTHHAPLLEGVPPNRRGGEYAPAYASDMHQEIAEMRPALWVNGHTHYAYTMELNGTVLMSSPRGYVGHAPDYNDENQQTPDIFMPRIITVPRVPAPSIDEQDDETYAPRF